MYGYFSFFYSDIFDYFNQNVNIQGYFVVSCFLKKKKKKKITFERNINKLILFFLHLYRYHNNNWCNQKPLCYVAYDYCLCKNILTDFIIFHCQLLNIYLYISFILWNEQKKEKKTVKKLLFFSFLMLKWVHSVSL